MDIEPVVNPQDIIFLSASVPHRPEWVADSKPAEIEEAIISLARAVFARGGRLLFGGHPSVSPLIAAVAGEYFPANPSRQIRPVITFQSSFFRGRLPDETWEMYRMGWTTIEWTPQEMLNGVPNQDSSLESMRRRMLLDPELIDADPDARLAVDRNKLGAPKAMVVIGGMEGIAEEVAIFLEFRERWRRENPDVISLPPVYAFTSGGGAAQRLLDAPDTFAAGLWPRSERSVSSTELNKRMKRLAILKMARSEGKFIPVEEEFHRELEERGMVPALENDSPGFQPYAALSQWLVERVGLSSE